MRRIVCLHEATALRKCASGATGDLMQKLEGALAGARICACEPEIAIDNADGCEIGKMVAFGYDLRADDDLSVARLDAFYDLAHLCEARDEI
jgi:hypothetical protein